MNSLDNLHRSNDGWPSRLGLTNPPVSGTAVGHRGISLDLGGPPGNWDRLNRRPLPRLRATNQFLRRDVGRDVPGQETLSASNPFQTHSFVPLGMQHHILPGGTADSWVLYQNNLRPHPSKLRF